MYSTCTPSNPQTLKINPAKADIDSFTFEDLELLDYRPHKKIAMQMAV
jgi:thymidylate synthase